MVKQLLKEGYTVKESCKALELSRSRYYSIVNAKEAEKPKQIKNVLQLLIKIRAIKAEHPFWGYRRVTAWLRHREGVLVNRKTVRKIMKDNGLLASQTVHKAKRKAERRKPRAHRPKEIWGIDMTRFMIPGIGWVYLVIVLDCYTKKIVGWEVSLGAGRWLNEFGGLKKAKEKIEDWIRNYYSRVYVHSSLDYLSPEEYELKYYKEQIRNVA